MSALERRDERHRIAARRRRSALCPAAAAVVPGPGARPSACSSVVVTLFVVTRASTASTTSGSVNNLRVLADEHVVHRDRRRRHRDPHHHGQHRPVDRLGARSDGGSTAGMLLERRCPLPLAFICATGDPGGAVGRDQRPHRLECQRLADHHHARRSADAPARGRST